VPGRVSAQRSFLDPSARGKRATSDRCCRGNHADAALPLRLTAPASPLG
jgi:hypothetical protein